MLSVYDHPSYQNDHFKILENIEKMLTVVAKHKPSLLTESAQREDWRDIMH